MIHLNTQIVSLNEEVRRALYQERLSNIDFEQYLPELIGQTEVLTDEYRKQLAKHLPARVEGNEMMLFAISINLNVISYSIRLSVDARVQHVTARLHSRLAVPQDGGHRQPNPAHHWRFARKCNLNNQYSNQYIFY